MRGGGRSVSSSLIGCAPRAWLIGRSFTVPAGSYRVFFIFIFFKFFFAPISGTKGPAKFYRVSYWVLLGFVCFSLVFTGFDWMLLGFDYFDWVLQGFTGL